MKIDIIFGGRSTEYDASVNSYLNVIESFKLNGGLDRIGRVFYLERESCSLFDRGNIPFASSDLQSPVKQFDRSSLVSEIKKEDNFLFSLLHGNEGEDGCFQGVAEFFDIEGSFESAEVASLTMNKLFCQKIVSSSIHDLCEIPSIIISKETDMTQIESFVRRSKADSFVLKPNSLGASLFTNKFDRNEVSENIAMLTEGFKFSREFLMQEYVQGDEYTVGIVNREYTVEVLPMFSPKTDAAFLGHGEKHKKGKIKARMLEKNTPLSQRLEKITRQIWDVLWLQYFARIDYIVTNDEKIFFLEVNSIPGLMKSSIFPKMLSVAEITIPQMILDFSKVQRQRQNKNFRYEIE